MCKVGKMESKVEQRAKATKPHSFLRSLKENVAGNVIAITAASVVPTVGLIGAGVDMSRMYMAKTRLQGACDSATLMARKVMGLNTWTSTETQARAAADQAFNINFPAGVYGTNNLTKDLSADGTVIGGTASVDVPMTLTKVIGAPTRTITVDCKAELTIPNTDVMFVLDTTGSMSWNAAGGTASTTDPSRIDGLKVAVKCFYEALAKENIDDVTPAQCNETVNPTGGNYSHVQLRFGFVPYSVNVNVGKLLPLNYMADNWTYQSRTPLTGTTYNSQPIYGNEGGRQNEQSNTDPGTGGWVDVPADINQMQLGGNSKARISGIDYVVNRFYRDNGNSISSQSHCNNITPRPSDITNNGSPTAPVLVSTNPAVLVPGVTTSVTKTYQYTTSGSGTRYQYLKVEADVKYDPAGGGHTVNGDNTSEWDPAGGYRNWGWSWNGVKYVKVNTAWTYYTGLKHPHSSNRLTMPERHCRLQKKIEDSTTTVTFQTVTPITWDSVPVFDRWSYQPVTFNVSGLKRNNVWNNTLSLPVGDQGTFADINWNGCIEERETVRITGTDPTGQWNTVPAGAWDMKIDAVPVNGQSNTQWGPQLREIIYPRYEGSNSPSYDGNDNLTNGRMAYTETASNLPVLSSGRAACPTESRLQQEWQPANFKSYVNSLATGGNTYHDIGLLWGARLASPDGIYTAINKTPNKSIERHMIFMTDGDTNSINVDYNAYGVGWWDRRQTEASSAPLRSTLETNIDERTKALCTAIKNKNITLWVIAYGSTIDNATKTRLESCASPNRYFVASNTTALMTRFKSIASDISQLRLTN
jgi:hypothetical protein